MWCTLLSNLFADVRVRSDAFWPRCNGRGISLVARRYAGLNWLQMCIATRYNSSKHLQHREISTLKEERKRDPKREKGRHIWTTDPITWTRPTSVTGGPFGKRKGLNSTSSEPSTLAILCLDCPRKHVRIPTHVVTSSLWFQGNNAAKRNWYNGTLVNLEFESLWYSCSCYIVAAYQPLGLSTF